jgi:hypothetical protein
VLLVSACNQIPLLQADTTHSCCFQGALVRCACLSPMSHADCTLISALHGKAGAAVVKPAPTGAVPEASAAAARQRDQATAVRHTHS